MKPLTCLVVLAVVQACSPGILPSQTITTGVVDGGRADDVGEYSSMALVDGKPAIAYYAGTLGDLMLARNAAADGSGAWTVTTVARAGTTGLRPSLAVVGGKPAIAFYHSSPNPGLRLATNANADGSGAWTIVTVGPANNAVCSLAEVSGKPGVTYRNGSLTFARNSAADGSGTWTTATVDPAADTTGGSSLQVIGGVPMIAYRDEVQADLKFARNNMADGSGNWSRTTVESAGNTGLAPSLADVGGVPAIAYYDQTLQLVRYAVNSAANGSGAWTVRSTGAIVSAPPRLALASIAGNPAVGVSAASLSYLRATAADGSGAWIAVPLESGTSVGGSVSLLVGGGFPLLAYRDSIRKWLKFGRAGVPNGLSGWTHSVVDDGSQSDGFAGLASAPMIVLGSPALAYQGLNLRFARADLPDGSGGWSRNDVSPDVPTAVEMRVVDGNPGIAYQTYVGVGLEVRFSRNSAPEGNGTWTTQSVGSASGDGIGLAVVAGLPAISCSAIDGLRYYRNTAPDGSGTWTPTLVDSSTTNSLHSSLTLVAGRPAIAYCDGNSGQVKFARANSADGTGAWTVSTVGAVPGFRTSLQIVDGLPAIVFLSGLQIYYARNGAADGSGTWTLVPVGSANATSPAFAVTGGLPTISFMDFFTSDLRLARCSSSDGLGQWQTLTVDSAGEVGSLSALLPLGDGRAAISYYDGADRYDQKWATVAAGLLTVEQPAGVPVEQLTMREVLMEPGAQSVLTLTLRNSGSEAVQQIALTFDPVTPANFEIGLPPTATLAPFGGTTVCTVVFKGIAYGRHTANVRVNSNNPTDGPQTIQLISVVLSVNQDADGDGLNDSAEYQLRALGFDWQAAQPQLVAALQSGANAAGLFNASQVQAMYVGTPLVQRNAATGQFNLRFGLRKSSDLQNYVAFPFVPGQTTINGSGEVEFVFGVPDNAAFFQLRTQP